MTKIDVQCTSLLTLLSIVVVLVIPRNLNAQKLGLLQESLQACLLHEEVQPVLRAVSYDDKQAVLAIEKNAYTPADLKVIVFGKEAQLMMKTELFFRGIVDYITITDVSFLRSAITLTFNTDEEFSCTYDSARKKVKRLSKVAIVR